MSDEVVAQGIQAAGYVRQAHTYLDEQADASFGCTVLNHSLAYLKQRTKTLLHPNAWNLNGDGHMK